VEPGHAVDGELNGIRRADQIDKAIVIVATVPVFLRAVM